MLVKIKSCVPGYWYNDLLGLEFVVKKKNNLHYIVGGKVVCITDCEPCEYTETVFDCRIPFNLDDYKTGNFNVVTQEGLFAEIITILERSSLPVVAKITDIDSTEYVTSTNSSGMSCHAQVLYLQLK